MWKLFQMVVFLSVSFTGIYYEWTPNGYVLGLLSIGAAFFATLILSQLLSWTFKARDALLRQQRANDRLPSRRQIP